MKSPLLPLAALVAFSVLGACANAPPPEPGKRPPPPPQYEGGRERGAAPNPVFRLENAMTPEQAEEAGLGEPEGDDKKKEAEESAAPKPD